ncbi:MAG: hypothetical protein E7158_06640 [Firmicutes bacterium]|nr:hypothetical protein [Bacillota bacterium]
MNIPVRATNKVDIIKQMKNVILEIKLKNEEYIQNGFIMELAQSTKDMVDGIIKISTNEYMAYIIFNERPLYNYNYHGIVAESGMKR